MKVPRSETRRRHRHRARGHEAVTENAAGVREAIGILEFAEFADASGILRLRTR